MKGGRQVGQGGEGRREEEEEEGEGEREDMGLEAVKGKIKWG